MEAKKQAPFHDLLERVAKKAWAVFWDNLHNMHRISYEDAVMHVMEGKSDLAMPPDIMTRLNVQDVVRHMQETSQRTRLKNQFRKISLRRQIGLGHIFEIHSVRPTQKAVKQTQGTFL